MTKHENIYQTCVWFSDNQTHINTNHDNILVFYICKWNSFSIILVIKFCFKIINNLLVFKIFFLLGFFKKENIIFY